MWSRTRPASAGRPNRCSAWRGAAPRRAPAYLQQTCRLDATRRAGRRSWRGRTRYGFDYKTTCDGLPKRQDDDACDAQPLGWLALSAEICAGRPVLAAFRSRGSARGHMVVVKGFSTHGGRRVLVVDPKRLCPAGRDCEGELDEGFWISVRRVRRRLGRPRPLGRLLRDPAPVTSRSRAIPPRPTCAGAGLGGSVSPGGRRWRRRRSRDVRSDCSVGLVLAASAEAQTSVAGSGSRRSRGRLRRPRFPLRERGSAAGGAPPLPHARNAPQGRARASSANAVLILHGTGGTGGAVPAAAVRGRAVRPGPAARRGDATTSSCPTASGTASRASRATACARRFPHYGYADMVAPQYRLLTEGLGVDPPAAACMGTSMGGMHTLAVGRRATPTSWTRSCRSPACRRQIVGPQPHAGARWSSTRSATIPAWAGGDYTEPPRGPARSAAAPAVAHERGPVQWQKHAPDAARRRTPSSTSRSRARLPGDRRQRHAVPVRRVARLRPVVPTSSAITAPAARDQLRRRPDQPARSWASWRGSCRACRARRYVLIPASERTRGHGTHTWAALWKQELVDFLAAPPSGAARGRRGRRGDGRERELVPRDRLGRSRGLRPPVADDYVAVRATGDQTKAQVVDGYRAARLSFPWPRHHRRRRRARAGRARPSSPREHARDGASRKAARPANRVRYLRVIWAKRDGAWRAVLQMAVPLPPP